MITEQLLDDIVFMCESRMKSVMPPLVKTRFCSRERPPIVVRSLRGRARLTHAFALVRAGTGTSRNLSNPFRGW